MEFQVRFWMGIMGGWRDRMLIIENDAYIIKRSKKHKIFSKYNAQRFPLRNAKVEEAPLKNLKAFKSLNEDNFEFSVETSTEKNFIRAHSKNEKINIMNKLTEKVKELNSKNAFSLDYEKYKDEITKISQTKMPFDRVTLRFTHFQNLFLEMNQKLDTFKLILNNDKKLKNNDELSTVHMNLQVIKDEMKKQFDELIETVYDYHDVMEGDGDKNYDNQIISSELQNVNDHQNDIDLLSVSSDDEGGKVQDHKFSNDIKDFSSPLYDYPPRLKLQKEIKCGNNMLKEFIKSMSSRKSSLPIYFNEPISMLQKQCEKFYYSDLLDKAVNETERDRQLLYITGFIISEIFLNIGRFLKPFNPILGETYEYFDNSKHFRYFSEQVSHNPPITAYIGESNLFAVFGDTRANTSVKLLKGCLEVEFGNKTHIILKKTNDYYTFSRPCILMKGLLRQPIYSDYVGEAVIQSAVSSSCRCVLTFHEGGGKKPLGLFEGKVYNNEGMLTYLIGGNWKSEVYATSPDGSNRIDIVSIREEPYLKNCSESYVLPTYTCNLNYISEEMKNFLPNCDSRMRPDMREYEDGSTEIAQDLKNKIELKQNLRHQKFEEDKIHYKPYYFVNEDNIKSGDSVYMYNGQYWNDRKIGINKNLKERDIFNISSINN